MIRSAIKVIKRRDLQQPVAVAKTPQKEIKLNLGNLVKDWILEKRENKRVEKIFSENRIKAWKLVPEDLSETAA